MDELLEILEEINPDIDYHTCTTLVDDGIFTSFELVNVVTQIDDVFGVQILPGQIIPENFNSVSDIYRLIKMLEEDD